LAEFEDYCDGIGVAGEVDEVFKFVDIRLYIPFGLEVIVGFESHERRGRLILWAERRREFISEFIPRCEAYLSASHLLSYNSLGEGRHMSTLEVGQGPVDAHLVLDEV
jgi:hypothetical protein